MIPSIETCFDFMKKYQMFDNIKDHSVLVAKISKLIAIGLKEKGINISLKKTVAGALLHDIAKTMCLKSLGDHAGLGKEICLKENMDEIAEIVGEHVALESYSADNGNHNEEEIVYYADKRVMHDVIVSIDERMEDLVTRYGRDNKKMCNLIRENFLICKAVEDKIFTKLDFNPNHLSDLIDSISL